MGAFRTGPLAGLLAALLIGLGGLPVQAQEQRLGAPRVGVRAGVAYSQIRLEAGRTDRALGAAGGVMARFAVGDAFFVQPEVLYVQKGGRLEGTAASAGGPPVEAQLSYHLDYLEVPVTGQLRLPIRGVRSTVYAGPYAGVVVRNGISVTPGRVDAGQFEDRADYSRFDYGVVLGGSVGLPMGRHTLMLDLRYTLGLRDLDSRTVPALLGDVDRSAQNGAAVLSVGLLL